MGLRTKCWDCGLRHGGWGSTGFEWTQESYFGCAKLESQLDIQAEMAMLWAPEFRGDLGGDPEEGVMGTQTECKFMTPGEIT